MAKKKGSSKSIDTEMVKHVAYLVRLGIKEEEAQAYSLQFSEIINYFHLLNEVDTENVPPASETSTNLTVMRPDVARPSMAHEEFMKNVPRSEGDHVRVPQVFGEE